MSCQPGTATPGGQEAYVSTPKELSPALLRTRVRLESHTGVADCGTRACVRAFGGVIIPDAFLLAGLASWPGLLGWAPIGRPR